MPKKRIAGIILMVIEIIALINAPPTIKNILNGEGGILIRDIGYFIPGIVGFTLFMLSFNKKD